MPHHKASQATRTDQRSRSPKKTTKQRAKTTKKSVASVDIRHRDRYSMNPNIRLRFSKRAFKISRVIFTVAKAV
eukprot:scaffold10512_cov128-Isochrysis_galbana.AAC.1